MNKVIQNILNSNRTKDEKIKELDILSEQIEIAKGVLSGKFIYCPDCDDYYLAKSFYEETETTETKICVYEDWINSSGNEYADGFLDITYRICPKGHKHELTRNESEKIN
jgi:hypothetical protein